MTTIATYYPPRFSQHTSPVPHTRLERDAYYRWTCPHCKVKHRNYMLQMLKGKTGRRCTCRQWVELTVVGEG